jgi:hypothetical protein
MLMIEQEEKPPEDTKYYEEGETVTVLNSSSDTEGNLYRSDGIESCRCSGWSDGTNFYTEGSTFVMGNLMLYLQPSGHLIWSAMRPRKRYNLL